MKRQQATWIIAVIGAVIGCGGAQPAPEAPKGAREEGHPRATSSAPAAQQAQASKATGDPVPAEGIAAKEPPGPGTDSPQSAPKSPGGAPQELIAAAFDLAESPGAAALAAGAEAVRQQKWVKARAKLDRALSTLEPSGSLDAIVAGHALNGRSCAALNDARGAKRAFEKVLSLWQASGSAYKLAAAGGGEAEVRERRDRAVLAVGESLFFFAEQKRLEAEKIKAPVYQGNGSRKDVLEFVKAKFSPFVRAKRPLVEESELAYRRVLDLSPAAPARWAIASASRMGQIWAEFVAEFRAAPVPKEWTKPGADPVTLISYQELRDTFYKSLEEASEPHREQARTAFEVCRDLSQRAKYEDEFSKACVTWLEKNPR